MKLKHTAFGITLDKTIFVLKLYGSRNISNAGANPFGNLRHSLWNLQVENYSVPGPS